MKCNLPISSPILLYNLSYLVWRGEHRHSSGVILREKLQKRFVTSDLPCTAQNLAFPENRAQGMGPGPQFALSHNGGTSVRARFMLRTKPSIFNFNFNKSGRNIKHGMENWIQWLLHEIPFRKNILIYIEYNFNIYKIYKYILNILKSESLSQTFPPV